MRVKKKWTILLLASFAILIIVFFLYLSRINISGNIKIRISASSFPSDSVHIIGVSPLGRKFEFPKILPKKQCEIHGAQLNKLVFFVPAKFLQDTSFIISINNQTFNNDDFQNLTLFEATTIQNHSVTLAYKPNSITIGRLISGFVNAYQNAIILILMFFIVYFFRRTNYLQAANKILFGTILTTGFFWLFLASFYCFPNAEDILISLPARFFGIWGGAVNLSHADGRYFTNLLYSINPLVFGWFKGYMFLPIAIVLGFIGSLWFFLQSVFRKWISGQKLMAFTLLFVLIHFALVPSLVHELYWMASSFAYMLTWIFTFLWMAFIICYLRADKPLVKYIWFGFGAILLFCSTGIHEMLLVFNTLLVFSSVIYIHFRKKEKKGQIILLGIFWLICILLFFLSPGAISRFDRVGGEVHDFSYYMGLIPSAGYDYAFTIIHFFFGNWIIIPSILLISLILIKTLNIAPAIEKKLLHHSVLSIIFLLPALLLMTAAYYIPLGADKSYPLRIYNIIQLGLQLMAFISLPLILRYYTKTWINKKPHFSGFIMTFALTIILYFSILGNGNISLIRSEFISGKLSRFKHEMNQRYEIFFDAKNGSSPHTALLDTLMNKPESIYHPTDISNNRSPAKWNVAYEKYFGLDEVRFKTDTINIVNLRRPE